MNSTLNCVMLVDDHRANNIYSSIILTESDPSINIIPTGSVKEALDYLTVSGNVATRNIKTPFPDLILLDMCMPEFDGWDFLNFYKIVKNGLFKQPVIIMLSSSVDTLAKLKVANISEVSDIYEKPLSSEIFKSIIDKYFV